MEFERLPASFLSSVMAMTQFELQIARHRVFGANLIWYINGLPLGMVASSNGNVTKGQWRGTLMFLCASGHTAEQTDEMLVIFRRHGAYCDVTVRDQGYSLDSMNILLLFIAKRKIWNFR